MKTLLAALARLVAALVPAPIPVPVRASDGRRRRRPERLYQAGLRRALPRR